MIDFAEESGEYVAILEGTENNNVARFC